MLNLYYAGPRIRLLGNTISALIRLCPQLRQGDQVSPLADMHASMKYTYAFLWWGHLSAATD